MKKYLNSGSFLQLIFILFIAILPVQLIVFRSWHGAFVSFIGALAFVLIWVIKKRFLLELSAPLEIYYGFLIFSSLFLGELYDFYYRFQWWDDMLHLCSGIFFAVIGYSIITVQTSGLTQRLNAVFAFSFSLACSVMWEILEFSIDVLFQTNMQKFMGLEGQAALMDTMVDLIVNAFGAGLFLLLLYLNGRYQWQVVEKIVFKKTDPK